MHHKFRWLIALVSVTSMVAATQTASLARTGDSATPRATRHGEANLKGFIPAVAAAGSLSRYYVVMRAPSAADRILSATRAGTSLSGAAQSQAKLDALASQAGALAQARSLGAKVVFRYGLLVNAFSAVLSRTAAEALSHRADVASVQPVSIVLLDNSTSVPFIGAPKVWQQYGAEGQGMTLALVDTGIDYTHKDFGGPGTVEAYDSNNPDVVEPGTFPTKKVIGGYDFVGSNYDVLDDDPTNDIPRPDFDPLDRDGHGTHTGGTCCGIGVPGKVGPGVAPKVKILSYKVWDVGNSTDDVLVAAYERAVDPNQDGNTGDQADVLSFSGGVDYGTLNSVEAVAAQHVVDLGMVFVASAGNSGNQPAGGSAYIVGTPATARGVISVAASIDQFVAQTLTVDDPPTTLPDNGLFVFQDWSAPLTSNVTDLILDAREFDPPADPENPAPTDRQLCDSTPPGSFGGHIALVYKGSTGGGDCTGTEKVFRAQEMGASAVVLWNGFGGFPFGLAPGDFVDQITIPALMVSSNDSEALGDLMSPDAASGSFNTVEVTITLHADPTPIPGFEDSMTDFTSEGPARVTNDLKPDISAPGFDITSAGVGTGDDAAVLSGTSMAAPHVSGAAVLLRQLHPSWSPATIKAVLMNQAKVDLKNNDLSSPVPATVKGAGRVQVFESAKAVSVAAPASLSFGLRYPTGDTSLTQSFVVKNYDSSGHDYDVSTTQGYSDYPAGLATLKVAAGGGSFGSTASFHLNAGASGTVQVRLTLHPSVVPEALQELGWYYFNGNTDGSVVVKQNAPNQDILRLPWHVTPLAASNDSLSATSLDLSGGPATMTLSNTGAGTSFADLYLLGATDAQGSNGEEDIVAIGARSFTGRKINGTPVGIPTGTDAFGGIDWQTFLTADSFPAEPVEFVVQTAGIRNTTETQEIDIKVDVGADGLFADAAMQADFLVVKPPGFGGNVVVYDLSIADPLNNPVAVYFADYTNYNGNLTGLAVDAKTLGLTNGNPAFSYQVTACTGRFSGDVPGQFCDTAGAFDSGTGTYTARLDSTDPALVISPLVCGGFFGGGACDAGSPITVSAGSGPGDILAVFPNNPPSKVPTVVETT
jgi:minor extracellular serine protease Vpr